MVLRSVTTIPIMDDGFLDLIVSFLNCSFRIASILCIPSLSHSLFSSDSRSGPDQPKGERKGEGAIFDLSGPSRVLFGEQDVAVVFSLRQFRKTRIIKPFFRIMSYSFPNLRFSLDMMVRT